MTPEQLSQLYTQATVCAERLTLPFRSQVWRGMAGEFQGAGTGSSIDFQDHRAYVPGDDPRHINWQAYARTGDYSMKLYREEVRPVIDIILDVSESMFFQQDKAERTAELFYFTVVSAMQAGASTRLHLLKGASYREIPMDAVSSHHWLDTAKSLSSDHDASPLALDKVPMRGNAIRVLISDLLFEGDPTPPLRHLTQQQGKAILLAPFLQSEARPEWEGNYEFIDAEQTSHHPHRIEKSTLRQYHQAYREHFTQWHAAARRFNAPFARVSTNTDLLTALNEEAVTAGALTIS
ncbi:DUF58 domain-containing protein [Verrucomicrobiaceae bacterium 5K15]|uniref:DUF58 domain-containing protein n=1 Tax=Oceaniferula flava TaxID=2800421 RepID=A0AAE2V7R3_9BACT|nr:DUF58 domain-containing protein [Oceaniferula flavus]MBK1854247.1 DUF58 domain-containing protein [Oceaniferula flavus]MBM1135553.1 DUF58 domain-containing protein [Oceaniferula flavus]